MATTNGTTPYTDTTAPKRRGRPAGSKNKAKNTGVPYVFGSIVQKSDDTTINKYLSNEFLKEFFSLPDEVQDSIKTLMKWEEESKQYPSVAEVDNIEDLFE